MTRDVYIVSDSSSSGAMIQSCQVGQYWTPLVHRNYNHGCINTSYVVASIMVYIHTNDSDTVTSGMSPEEHNTTTKDNENTTGKDIKQNKSRIPSHTLSATEEGNGNMGQCMPTGCPTAPHVELKDDHIAIEISGRMPHTLPLQMTELPHLEPSGVEEENRENILNEYDNHKLTQTLKHIQQCAEISRSTQQDNKIDMDYAHNEEERQYVINNVTTHDYELPSCITGQESERMREHTYNSTPQPR